MFTISQMKCRSIGGSNETSATLVWVLQIRLLVDANNENVQGLRYN